MSQDTKDAKSTKDIKEKKPSLLEQLRQAPKEIKDESKDICALSETKKCCGGHGIKLLPHGAHTSAVLCECVTTCRVCRGRAQRIEVDTEQSKEQNLQVKVSKACKNPSPLRVTNIVNHATFPVRYRFASLDRFANKTGNHTAVVTHLRNWLNNFDPTDENREQQGVILGGHVGVGKTYLLVAIGKLLAFRGFTVKFVDFFQLVTEIKGQISNKSEFHRSLLEPLLKVDVLLIDELGKGRQTEFEHTIIDQLVMGRYNLNKPILASTNCKVFHRERQHIESDLGEESGSDNRADATFNPKHFPALRDTLGYRIYSRLMETTLAYELDGLDYRLKNKSQI